MLTQHKAWTLQDIDALHNSVAPRAPSDLQQHGALIPRPKTPDGAKRGSSSALACFGGGKVLPRFPRSAFATRQPLRFPVTSQHRRTVRDSASATHVCMTMLQKFCNRIVPGCAKLGLCQRQHPLSRSCWTTSSRRWCPSATATRSRSASPSRCCRAAWSG